MLTLGKSTRTLKIQLALDSSLAKASCIQKSRQQLLVYCLVVTFAAVEKRARV